MPTDDLTQHATSEHDFYDLLGVNFETSDSDIRRAYRRTALKYHPDKNAGNPAAVEKFHLLQIAYDVLTDPVVKAAYDNARAARVAKQRQREMFEGKRRQMMDDLERRERGVKRGRDEEVDAEERLRKEVARLAEDGKRRRREREEMLRREAEEEERQRNTAREKDAMEEAARTKDNLNGASGVSEIDRTIKVRWPREGAGQTIDKERLASVFSTFGQIENTFLLKDKRQRTEGKKEKRLVATGVIQFASIVGAHAAVEDFLRQSSPEWRIYESVFWASNKEPDLGFSTTKPASADSKSPSAPTAPSPSSFSTPDRSNDTTSPNLSNRATDAPRHVPSFASFSAAANRNTPRSSPLPKAAASTPSLEEITMIRLKKAEKKRLEDELRRREAEEERREEQDRTENEPTADPRMVPA